jgi:hypothetical protein
LAPGSPSPRSGSLEYRSRSGAGEADAEALPRPRSGLAHVTTRGAGACRAEGSGAEASNDGRCFSDSRHRMAARRGRRGPTRGRRVKKPVRPGSVAGRRSSATGVGRTSGSRDVSAAEEAALLRVPPHDRASAPADQHVRRGARVRNRLSRVDPPILPGGRVRLHPHADHHASDCEGPARCSR